MHARITCVLLHEFGVRSMTYNNEQEVSLAIVTFSLYCAYLSNNSLVVGNSATISLLPCLPSPYNCQHVSCHAVALDELPWV
jgi:hypothetical protein